MSKARQEAAVEASQDAPQEDPPRATLAGRWQIPLLGVGVLLFGGGLIRIAAAHVEVSFEQQLERVAKLHGSGALRRANAYLLDLLSDAERPSEQRGELHRLLAATAHQAETSLSAHNKQNIRAIITNFRSAVRCGVKPGAADWLSVGDAYRWSGSDAEAADAYRQALRLSPRRPDRILRRLLEAQIDSGRPFDEQAVADLDAMLGCTASPPPQMEPGRDAQAAVSAEPGRDVEATVAAGHGQDATSPDNYLWALDHKVEWLLAHGETAAALALVDVGKERLSGTAERLAVSYTEALCLCDGGTRYSDEAETLLRSLLSGWTVRDGLWGRASWLLGRLQQVDGRPQVALSFYDEVLWSFEAGDLHDGCVLGRAECLAALDRYERALDVFAGLKDRLLEERRHRYLDRNAVRMTVTATGESLLGAGSLELGIQYMQLALALADGSDGLSRATYMSRIAAGLTEMGMAAMAGVAGTKEDHDRARKTLRRAAECYVSLSQLPTLDEEDVAKAVESAVDDFDAAGMTDGVIDALSRFVEEHPTSNRRGWALHRLGQAYQAMRLYPDAVAAYKEAIEGYPRQLCAQESMVPLAECLLAMGGEEALRGADLLVDIVDDRGSEALFDPQAKEYRDALFRLIDCYCRATEQEVPQHFEKAIVRLEDAVALYPADPEITRLTFLLADAYRQSAQGLADQDGSALDERGRAEMKEAVDQRLHRAVERFEQVIAALAPHDGSGLTDLEQAYLRVSYLYRGDCLFDLGHFEEAIEAYNEAVWRYEDLPAAVSASMQIVHCHQRLGQWDEAAAALERLSWLLKKMPASAFEAERGMSTKEYWENMVARLQQTGVD
ncbi:MAG: tetratricopeptide repeat protein [Phycisphaerae bacterium]|nr:tetratricopeptide repeat protein [Phycisphaerae bacterium]